MPTTPPPDPAITYDQVLQALAILLPHHQPTEITWVRIEPDSITYETWHADPPNRRGHRVRVTHPQGAYTEGGEQQ